MTIAEVAKKYDVSADALRYYERIGLIPSVGRTSGGIRDYQDGDCRWIEFVKCMRAAGLPIEMLIEYVRLAQNGDGTLQARHTLLVEQRDMLTERIMQMQSTLDRLNKKIEYIAVELSPTEQN